MERNSLSVWPLRLFKFGHWSRCNAIVIDGSPRAGDKSPGTCAVTLCGRCWHAGQFFSSPMRGQESLKSCPYLSSTPRWTQPAPCFLSSGANRFHLGPPFLLLGFRYQSIDNLYKRKRIASVAKGLQTDRRLFVCDHHGAHTLVLFIYLSFQFFVCPPLFKNGRRRRRASWSGVEETCSPGATLSPSRKAAGGLPSSLTLPFGEREPFSSSSWRWEKGGRLLLLLHYKPSGTEGERERERKETRRIIISMTRDNVQKITIGKKKRRRCWTVVVAAETLGGGNSSSRWIPKIEGEFYGDRFFFFLFNCWLAAAALSDFNSGYLPSYASLMPGSSSNGSVSIHFYYASMWYTHIYSSLFFFNKSDRQVALFPSCFFTLWILKEKHIERERKKSSQSPDNGYIYCYLVIVMNFPGEGTMGPKQKQREANGSVLCLLREWESVKRVQLNKPANEIDVPCRDN